MTDEGDSVTVDESVADDDARALTRAVTELTRVVTSLDELLRRDYPKRSEIERRFTSKGTTRRAIMWAVVVAIGTVIGCFAISTGAYAVCFTGVDNPGICSVVPGYQDRIDRRDEINEVDRLNELRIDRLERELGLQEMEPEE
jgi:hypothetical protein